MEYITMFRTKDMYTVWDKLARNCIPCLGQSRPVAKIFYGRVRSYEEDGPNEAGGASL